MASTTPSDASTVELRASVLDAAISLGFRNSTMAKWMFDPLAEADDDEDAAEVRLVSLTIPHHSCFVGMTALRDAICTDPRYVHFPVILIAQHTWLDFPFVHVHCVTFGLGGIDDVAV